MPQQTSSAYGKVPTTIHFDLPIRAHLECIKRHTSETMQAILSRLILQEAERLGLTWNPDDPRLE